jgi:hypothetical protein
MRSAALGLLLLAACGLPEAQEGIPAVEQPLVLAERCTASTLQPGWECCDGDSLSCRAEGPVFCVEHRWQPLDVAQCERIAADPRRPELATYGTFCDTNAAGFLWCPSQVRAQ